MLYSKYCEYVIKALSYLAVYGSSSKYTMVREISEKTNIPYHFLSKIFQDLSTTNWVNSKKGRSGGFTLSVDTNNLTLLDIIKWSDGIHNFNTCILGGRTCGTEDYKCSFHNKCSELRNNITSFFENMTINDVSKIEQEHHFVQLK
jgi:Rrf2 family iron-sulfur cluster assembly transcriptional regulator